MQNSIVFLDFIFMLRANIQRKTMQTTVSKISHDLSLL